MSASALLLRGSFANFSLRPFAGRKLASMGEEMGVSYFFGIK